MCIDVLTACLCTMSLSGAPRGPEKDIGSPEPGVTVLGRHVDPGNQTQVLWKCSRYSTSGPSTLQPPVVSLKCYRLPLLTLRPIFFFSFKNLLFRSWRDGSAVKSTDCSSKGPEFNSQQPHGGSEPSVTRYDSIFWSV